MAKTIYCYAADDERSGYQCNEILLPGHADILHFEDGVHHHYCSRHWKIIGDRNSRLVESDQKRAVQKTDAWIAERYPTAEASS